MNKIEQAAEDFCKLRNYLNEQRDRRKDGTLRHSLEADTAIDAFISGWKACKEQMGEQAREHLAKTDLTLADLVAFDEGLALGRRLERQDIMKDAVEGFVYQPAEHYFPEVIAQIIEPMFGEKRFHHGDKVKIIIVKEE